MKKLIQLYRNLSLPLKASMWFTICTALQKCVAVITTPIFTRILNTTEYGVVSLYTSWESIVTIFATLYLTTGGGYFNGMKRYKDDRDGYTSSILCLVSLLTIVLYTVYIVVHLFAGDFWGLSLAIVTMMFIDIFFTSAISLWSVRNKYEYKYKEVVVYTFTTSVLIPLLGVVLIVLMPGHKAEARILGMVIAKVLIYGYIYYMILKKGKKLYSREYWGFSIKFNIPLLPHYLSQMVLNQSDRIMISDICGVMYAGIYSIAYNVSLLMKIFTQSINGTLTPWTYQCMEKKQYKKINIICLYIEILVGVGCFLVCLFAPEIIDILASEAYKEAFWVIPPVAISVLFMMLYSFFANIEFYFEKNKVIAIPSFMAAILNVLLNAIFIRKFGFIAAGYTTLACYFAYSIFHYYFMKRSCQENNIPCVYNGFLYWACALIFTFLCLSCNMLYAFTTARHLIIIVLMIVLIGGGVHYYKTKPEILKILWSSKQ